MKFLLRLVRDVCRKIAFRRAKAKGENEEAHYPHFFFSSLMDDRGGCDRCPIWSGRSWLCLADRLEWHWEWHWFTPKNRNLGFQVGLHDGDGEDGVLLSLSIPWLCNLYVGLEGLLPCRNSRRYGIEYHFSREMGQWGCLALLWASRDDWDDKDKSLNFYKSIDPCDVIFGKQVYSADLVRECSMELGLAWAGEREKYDANVKVERCSWVRPRDRFGWLTMQRLSMDIDIPGGIPIPGKGENSWDCDDDAIFGTGAKIEDSSDESLAKGWEKVAEGILETRRRHGGESWRPVRKESVAEASL